MKTANKRDEIINVRANQYTHWLLKTLSKEIGISNADTVEVALHLLSMLKDTTSEDGKFYFEYVLKGYK